MRFGRADGDRTRISDVQMLLQSNVKPGVSTGSQAKATMEETVGKRFLRLRSGLVLVG